MTTPEYKTDLVPLAHTIPGQLTTECPHCGAKILTMLGEFVATDPEDRRAAILCGLPRVCSCEAAKRTAEEQNAQEEAKEREKQKSRDALRLRERWEAAGMPSAWYERGLKQWHQTDPSRVAAYDAAVCFGAQLLAGSYPRSLYVVGDIGAGKTFLSSCLCADLLRKGRRVLWRNVSDVLREIRASYDNRQTSEAEVIARFAKPPVLVLDDLGKERPTEWAMEQLFSIINARYDANKPLILTTNYGGDDLVKRLTPRPDSTGYADDTTARAIVDRLRGMSKHVVLAGASRRKS